MKKHFLLIVLASMVVISGPGCVFLTSFHSPRVLQKGEVTVGVAANGLAVSDEDETSAAFGIPEINGRINIAPKTDLGLRIIFPAAGADLRYQLINRDPFFVAMGIAGSGLFTSDANFVTVTPSIAFGSENVYGGFKYAVLGGSFNEDDIEFEELGPGVMFGVVLGKRRLRFNPEINVYFPGEGTITGFGVALRYLFNRDFP